MIHRYVDPSDQPVQRTVATPKSVVDTGLVGISHGSKRKHDIDTSGPSKKPNRAGLLLTPSPTPFPRDAVSGEHAPSFVLAAISDKGQGLFSTRNLTPGEVIHAQKPFLTFSHPVDLDVLRAKLQNLSPRDRRLFHSFQGTIRDIADVRINRCETNAIPLSNEDEDGGEAEGEVEGEAEDLEEEGGNDTSGLFEHISRVNHSCLPNAGWRWDEGQGELVLRAHRQIDAGEEITASYRGDMNQTRKDRRRELSAKFGFRCLCVECDKPADLVQHNNAELVRLAELVETWGGIDELDHAWDKEASLLQVNEAIGTCEAYSRLSTMVRALDLKLAIYAAWGQGKDARRVQKRIDRVHEIISGPRSIPDLVSETPESHMLWKKCSKVCKRFASGEYESDSEWEGSVEEISE